MTDVSVPPTTAIRIDHYSAVHMAAQAAGQLAERCGLSGALPHQAAVVASELGSNLAKHATDGALYLQELPAGGGMEVLAADRGPGMPELEQCLADGYSTTGTLGAGLGAVSRIATHFSIRSGSADGTLACARLCAPERRPACGDGVGAVCLPAEGEQESGDGCTVVDTEDFRTAIVVDGLGHGPAAAEAAQTALRAFRRVPEAPLPDVLTTVHRALRRTRGAAVGLLRLHEEHGEYCGVGNIRVLVLGPDGVHHRLTGRPGIAGLQLPAASRVSDLPLGPDGIAVLHTDGINHRWSQAPPLFTLRLPPPLLAASLAHGHRITRDDATVLAATSRQRMP
ncbi:SpoIIE family protein phosphatase [Streptomyces sp. Ru73]|uniref:SpoIIE family protein phosphatase n=1 Tax=Streptomyces sp. Ru73 TaxID=2080748 RepID=UPI0021563AFB|nr:SpoIIE family protein phosphatase [Streptomyces sp. Ru73]